MIPCSGFIEEVQSVDADADVDADFDIVKQMHHIN